MHDSKLITILKTLSSDEFNKFREYVISPFFNKNKNITLLFNFIKKYYPKFNSNNFTKEKGFVYIFPGEKFNDSKLRVLMAKLLKLLEDYLVLLKLSDDICLKSITLQTIIRNKKMMNYYEGYDRITKKTLDSFPYRNHEYYDYLLKYNFEYHGYAVSNKQSGTFSLQKLSDSLDIYYLNRKLSFCADMIQREKFHSTHYRKPFYDYIMNYLKKLEGISKKDLSEMHSSLAIYFNFNLLFSGINEKIIYGKTVELLKKYANKFSPKEAYYLYDLLTTFLDIKTHQGEKDYMKDLFELYKHLLNQKLFYPGNIIVYINYHNIASVAFQLKEFKWAQDFLFKYKNKLDSNHRENLFNLELTWLNYHKKEYDKALSLLNKIEITNYKFYLDTREILTKIYYETDEIKSMFPLLDSFRHYLTRNKLLSKELKKSYLNYNNIIQKLFRIKIGEKDNIFEVKKMIKETQFLEAKDWLMEKANELE